MARLIGLRSRPGPWMPKTEKLWFLKSYVENRWVDSIPFNWDIFENVILPKNDSERKPAPFMFQEAISVAPACPLVFMGETLEEIVAANDLGFSVKLVPVFKMVERYVPQAELINHMKDGFSLPYNDKCFDLVR